MSRLNYGQPFPRARRFRRWWRHEVNAGRPRRLLWRDLDLARVLMSVVQRTTRRVLACGRHAERTKRQGRHPSVDDENTSAAPTAKRRLRLPVGRSADADNVAATIGAYANNDRTVCSRPASSWRLTGRCAKPCTRAGPSGGWSPTTSSASSGV